MRIIPQVISENTTILNGETECNIIVKFTSEDPKGSVIGISTIQNYKSPEEILGKIEPIDDEDLAGSVLTFAADFYTYEGGFEDMYATGNELTIDPEHVIKVDNMYLDNAEKCIAMYKLTDIYANEYWTGKIPYSE